jgi:hypothetical protein
VSKLCVYWQGRKSTSVGVRKHAVFQRCYTNVSLSRVLQVARSIAKRRGSSSLTSESSGLAKTLMTCHKSKCKVTHFGRKLGLKR